MDDAGASRHPLHAPRAEKTAIAERIRVLHLAVEHIGDRLDAPMRVPREALGIEPRIVVAEVVHHQERIGQRRVAEAEDTVQVHASAFERGLRLAGGRDRSKSHGSLQISLVIVWGFPWKFELAKVPHVLCASAQMGKGSAKRTGPP